MEPSKNHLLASVAIASGRADAAATIAEKARVNRDTAMLRARKAGVPYTELQDATGLTRTGVYKALSSAAGGSLKAESTTGAVVD
jgi:hypothetical protein